VSDLEQDRVRTFAARDGATWAPMRVWEHRRSAAMCRYDSMRGLPDDADITESPAWLRSRARRMARLEARRG
jgi:hypothetical protein